MTDSRTLPAASGGVALTAYRWLTVIFTVMIVLQAYLGSNGAFNTTEWMVTGHGHLANGMFLIVILQTVLAWVLQGKRLSSMRAVALNVALVALTIGQIGLGYSTRNGEIWGTMVSLHIPNGVLLMGLSTLVTFLAWRISDPAARS